MGMDFRGLVWKRVWIITFFLVWNRVRISRTGRHTPTKNSQEHPPGSPKHSLLVMPHEFLIEFNQYFLPFQSEGKDRMASMDTKITVKRLLMWSSQPKPEKTRLIDHVGENARDESLLHWAFEDNKTADVKVQSES